jgi:hypothetical protein
LVKFFAKSRDKWKAKARASKGTIKQLKNRIRFLEASKGRWKEKATVLEAQRTGMPGQGRARAAEWEALKKSRGRR